MKEEEYLQLIEGKLEAAIENIKDEMKLNDKDIAPKYSSGMSGPCSIVSIPAFLAYSQPFCFFPTIFQKNDTDNGN